MKESMYSYFKPGIVHFMAYPETIKGEGPVYDTVKRFACDDYFDAIEITWIKDEEVRRRTAKMLEASKIKVCYGAQPRLLTTGMNINDIDEAKRLEALNSLKEGVDEAKFMGSKALAFLSGKYEEERKEEYYEALVKSTRELCAYAKERDMNIVLEIFDYDIDKASIIGPTDLAKRFADEITAEYDNFGLMVDLSHIPMYRESITQAIEPIKEYIVHAHMGNTVIASEDLEGYGDSHPRFGFEGGENDTEELTRFLEELLRVGFLNKKNPPVVSFEVKPWKDEDPEVVIANAKRTLNEAWLKVENVAVVQVEHEEEVKQG